MFDYSILHRQIITAYKNCKTSWSKVDVMKFFDLFYLEYFNKIGTDHPRLKTDTIAQIIEKLPCDDLFTYELDDYRQIIPQYFNTEFRNCDYSLVHFMSGSIRQMRIYEVEY